MEDERYVGQRGPDKEIREFNPKSLLNLKQFQKLQQNSEPRVSSTDWSKLGTILFLIAMGFLIWKIWNRRKSRDNE